MSARAAEHVAAVATAADVLTGRDPQDHAGNLATLKDAGWLSEDAHAEAARFKALGMVPPVPLPLDFNAVPDPPDWIVDRLVERGTVVVLSGDTGSAKSIVSQALVPAALSGTEWLGHGTAVDRLMVVDEENPERLVTARLRALGTTNGVTGSLRYFSRQGVALGDGGAWDAWVRLELEAFRPDLLVIDTLMAACAVEDTNSNSEAVRVMKALRALAREFRCAILLLHHERKRAKDHPASSGQAMMGARQWAGQADAQMTLTVESDLIEDEPDEDGCRHLRRTFKFRPAEKDRDGRSNVPRRIAVESEKDEAGRLLSMTVSDEGPITEDTRTENVEVAILSALHDGETLATGALAAAAGEDDPSKPSGTFKRALAGLVETGRVERPKRGHYAITDHGRENAALAL